MFFSLSRRWNIHEFGIEVSPERSSWVKIFEQSRWFDSNTFVLSALGSLTVWDTALVET